MTAAELQSVVRSAVESAVGLTPVTPSDSVDLVAVARALSWGVDGAVKITCLDGTVKTIPAGALAVGTMHSIYAVRVWATGTTATGIIAWS